MFSPPKFTRKGVSSYVVRLESRAREFISVARLTKVAIAKAKTPQFTRGLGVKAPELLGYDLKPVDLALSRVKSFERGMEARLPC